MARKTNHSTAKKVTPVTRKIKTRPRTKTRGWSVLSKRWAKLFSQFSALTIDTLRFWRSRLNQRLMSILLMIVGIIGMGMWANYWWTKNEQARANQQIRLAETLAPVAASVGPQPTRIFIKWFVDSPITRGIVEGNNWTLSEQEAVYITQSARPGEKGNVIIYGHNTREVLGNIRALKGTEIITLTMDDGSTRDYQVKEMKEIKPEVVSDIQPTDYEVLTLYTCSGFADKNRFVVRAYPVEQ
jgi:LPXTG-site transpeptidase (sortase) family protein